VQKYKLFDNPKAFQKNYFCFSQRFKRNCRNMEDFLGEIYRWYANNKRDLPWRIETDPYKIWISEIILQQTRVEQGKSYYYRFTQRFPTVCDLAGAEEDEVLKLWQGLGYYSRARNLHSAARAICLGLKGVFPATYKEILGLKGTGPYTAAAVSSIAFNLPHPALDGNVVRVLARYFGIQHPVHSVKGKKIFQKTADDLMNAVNPGFHNQALMEFGALQCKPGWPDCQKCPVAGSCYALQHKQVAMLPVKVKKPVKKKRYFYYYYIESKNTMWIEKRRENDIWKNLYQLPLVELADELNDKEIVMLQPWFLKGSGFNLKSVSSPLKHILTHQVLTARLIRIEILDQCQLPENFLNIKKKEIDQYAFPVLLENIIRSQDCL
jgi:A/G-specific adenine glycosylase